MSIDPCASEIRSVPYRAEGPNPGDQAGYRFPSADFGPQKTRGNRFFSNVSETSIRAMDGLGHIASYSKDAVVFLEGDRAHGIYILHETVQMSARQTLREKPCC